MGIYWHKRFKVLGMVALLAVLTGAPGYAIASQQPDAELDDIQPNVVGTTEYNDPLIRLNRVVFAFNDVSYRYVLVPAARTYLNVTPDPVRKGIGNFFYNLRTPIYAINHLLQGKPGRSATDLARFLVNTTVGIAGIFDPAQSWLELERETTSAGATLARYGVGYGAYLVLPFAGASNLRDGTGMFLDAQINIIPYLLDDPESTGLRIFDNFQLYAPVIEAYPEISAESQDPYIFLRNLHLQGLYRDSLYPPDGQQP